MPRKITTEYSQAVFNLPWLVAADEGLFAEEDLEVEFLRGVDRPANLAADRASSSCAISASIKERPLSVTRLA